MIKLSVDQFAKICETHMRVVPRDRAGSLVPFTLWPQQLILVREFVRQWNERGCVRMHVLKDRRAGSSTVFLALQLYLGMIIPNYSCYTIADKDDNTQAIQGILATFITTWHFPSKPESSGLPVASSGHRPSTGKLKLHESLTGATFATHTAKGKPPRGGGVNFIQLSEYGFYPDPDPFMQAVQNTIPGPIPGSVIVVESTGDASNSRFKSEWDANIEAGAKASSKPVFISFHLDPAKSLDAKKYPVLLTRQEVVAESIILTDEEQGWGLSIDKINWLRSRIKDNNGDFWRTANEFPPSPDYAFRAAASSVWDRDALIEYGNRARAVIEGKADGVDFHFATIEAGQIVESSNGAIRVFRIPEKGARYVIAADPITGDSYRVADSDEAAIQVLKVLPTGDILQCAAYNQPFIEPEQFAEMLFVIAYEYASEVNGHQYPAYCVIESNGPGGAVIKSLIRAGFPTSRMFKERHMDRSTYRALGDMRYGYRTTMASKAQAYGAAAAVVRNRTIELNDQTTLNQMHNCSLVRGAPKAVDRNKRDDLVSSLMIGVHAIEIAAHKYGVVKNIESDAIEPKTSGSVSPLVLLNEANKLRIRSASNRQNFVTETAI